MPPPDVLVRKGDVLFEIDSRPFVAALSEQKANSIRARQCNSRRRRRPNAARSLFPISEAEYLAAVNRIQENIARPLYQRQEFIELTGFQQSR